MITVTDHAVVSDWFQANGAIRDTWIEYTSESFVKVFDSNGLLYGLLTLKRITHLFWYLTHDLRTLGLPGR